MTTIKAYTDLQQSKKLAEILLLESADMCWQKIYDENHMMSDYRVELIPYRLYSGIGVPCWSLAALLDILNKNAYFANEAGIAELSSIKATKWCINILNCGKIEDCYADNPIDACYEMIIRLHELKML